MRVLIVDDHPRVRSMVRSSLDDSEAAEIVGEASDGKEALSRIEQLHPDVVFMDINMPVLDGITATRIIRKTHPNIHVVIYSLHKEQWLIEAAREIGASGYLAKEDDGPAIRSAIEAIQHGTTYFPNDGKVSGTSAGTT